MSHSYPEWLADCQNVSYTVWGGVEPFKTILDIGSPDYTDPDSLADYLDCWKINFPFFFFSFGFAPELEKRAIPVFEKLYRAMSRRGMHPVVYLKANSLFATSFFDPRYGGFPEAREWIHKTPGGTWYPYWIFPDRYLVCVGSQGWFDTYLLPKAKEAVDRGAEGIFLDNVEAGALCYCDGCKSRFRKRLREKFPEEALRQRGIDPESFDPAGLVEGDFHTMTEFDRGLPEIGAPLESESGSAPARAGGQPSRPLGYWEKADWRDPVWQEWVLMHTEQLSSMLNRLSVEIKRYGREKHGKEVLVCCNFGGFKDHRLSTSKGIWFEDVDIDLYLFEWNYPVTFAQRLAMQAQCPGKRLISYGKKLLYAFGDIWFPSMDDSDPGFPRRMADYFVGYRSKAQAGIVFSIRSVLWDGRQADFERCADALLPWLPVEGVSLTKTSADELARFRVLVLPNVSCLSEPEISVLAGYLKTGGTLFYGPQTGLRDERAQLRSAGALREIAAGLSREERKRLVPVREPSRLGRLLRKVDFDISALKGQAEIITFHRGANDHPWVSRIVNPKDLCLKVKKWDGWEASSACVISQDRENLGKVPLFPKPQGNFLLYDIPDSESLVLFVVDRHRPPVLLEAHLAEILLASDPEVSADVTLRNPGAEVCEVDVKATSFEDPSGSLSVRLRAGPEEHAGGSGRGLEALRLQLAPHEKRRLTLSVSLLRADAPKVIAAVTIQGRDVRRPELVNLCTVKVRRSVFAAAKFPLPSSGPECPANPDSAGSGAVVFNGRQAMLLKTSGLCTWPGMSYRELMDPQEVSRHGPVTGFVTQWPRHQMSRYMRPDIRLSPGFGSYLVSDRIHDQNELDRSSLRQEAVAVNTHGSSRVRFSFSQPPFEVTETVTSHPGDPCFSVSYLFKAVRDDTVFRWYLPRVGIPGAPVGEPELFPRTLSLAYRDKQTGKGLVLAIYSNRQYDFFSRGRPKVEESPNRFDFPVLCVPISSQTVLEVRKGDTFQFDFALIPCPKLDDGALAGFLERLNVLSLAGDAAITEARYDPGNNTLAFVADASEAHTVRVLRHWAHPRAVAAAGSEIACRESRDIIELDLPRGVTRVSIAERSAEAGDG